MNWKTKRRILAGNLFLFALLFGLVSLNKEILRPAVGNMPVVGGITGCLPNFLAAYLIGLAFVNAVMIREPKYGHILVYTGSSLIFLALTVEELKPMWGASTIYDPFDIAASGLGSVLSILTFQLMVLRRKDKKN